MLLDISTKTRQDISRYEARKRQHRKDSSAWP